MKLETLHDCLALKAMCLYDVETQILKALPKMIKNSTSEKLKEAFTEHMSETENHVQRIEQIFEILDVKPKKTKVEAIRGIIDDATWITEQDTIPATQDTLLIGAARHVEHYEISGYMALLDWAKMLGLSEVASLAEETLEEEKNADAILSDLAEVVATEANDGQVDEELSTDNTEPSEGADDEEMDEEE
jgi:ferritin-like metal-binding protein YciE